MQRKRDNEVAKAVAEGTLSSDNRSEVAAFRRNVKKFKLSEIESPPHSDDDEGQLAQTKKRRDGLEKGRATLKRMCMSAKGHSSPENHPLSNLKRQQDHNNIILHSTINSSVHDSQLSPSILTDATQAGSMSPIRLPITQAISGSSNEKQVLPEDSDQHTCTKKRVATYRDTLYRDWGVCGTTVYPWSHIQRFPFAEV